METGLQFVPAKTLLSGYAENNNWFGMHYNMNIYRGCCHGCIYCDSRSECYGVEQFDTVRAKKNALTILDGELRTKRKRGVVGTGAMSDPYNPFEQKAELTRGALKLMAKYGYGVGIATKSDLIARDIDLLCDIQKNAPVLAKITLTTVDDALAKKIEPHAPAPSRRLAAIRALSQAGIPVCVLLMPVLPFIEDDPAMIQALVQAAAAHGAGYIYGLFGVTLRANQRQYFFDRLEERFPGMKEKYVKQFGLEYACHSPRTAELTQTLETACEETGMVYRMQDIIQGYQGPYKTEQISLLGT